MAQFLNNNTIPAAKLEISAKNYLSGIGVLRSVRIANVLDADGKRTNSIDSIRYDCIDPNTFDTFTIKVPAGVPIISNDALEASDEPVCIEIPVDETVIRPYSIEYGRAKVSIIAPYVKLAGK